MSPEETKRLPLNALMLKAMHDRERLEETAVSKAGDGRSADLDARDRETVLKADHFLRFAGASYGMLGYLGRMKALVTEETAKGVPPPDLVTRCDGWLLFVGHGSPSDGGGSPVRLLFCISWLTLFYVVREEFMRYQVCLV